MLNKKFFLSLAAVWLCGTALTFAAVNPFTDVPFGHWAYNSVVSLTAKETFNGYGDGIFKGDKNITRYEAAHMVAKALAGKK